MEDALAAVSTLDSKMFFPLRYCMCNYDLLMSKVVHVQKEFRI